MVVLSHPTGNQFVRQALLAFEEASQLDRFYTTVSWDSRWRINSLLPKSVRSELSRRCYPQIPASKIRLNPVRAAAGLLSQKFGLAQPEYLSFFKVCDSLDQLTAKTIRQRQPKAVYAYEGVALRTFREAKRHSTTCIYELPSGYWYYEVDLLREEAELRPEYADTIAKLKDPPGHNANKDQELALADHIVVPSRHVVRTLKGAGIPPEKLHVVPYGANESNAPIRQPGSSKGRKLRVMFVGALTQRKGIGYLIDAINQLGDQVEFTILGGRVGTSTCLDEALRKYRWIPSAPHPTVLAEMAAHDVLVLPSLSEGFALVISEAMSRGLPVITTLNSGGEEIIEDGVQGFFVNIRSSEAIVEKIDVLDRDRGQLDAMSQSAVQRAAAFGWQRYRQLLISTLQPLLN